MLIIFVYFLSNIIHKTLLGCLFQQGACGLHKSLNEQAFKVNRSVFDCITAFVQVVSKLKVLNFLCSLGTLFFLLILVHLLDDYSSLVGLDVFPLGELTVSVVAETGIEILQKVLNGELSCNWIDHLMRVA